MWSTHRTFLIAAASRMSQMRRQTKLPVSSNFQRCFNFSAPTLYNKVKFQQGRHGLNALIASLFTGGVLVGSYHAAQSESLKEQLLPFTTTQVSSPKQPESSSQEIINWSGTHTVSTEHYYEPETTKELEEIVRHAHETKQKIRPVGSALSPNGLGLSSDGMVNLVMMDKIISVDTEKKQVVVQAGARVNQVVEALRPHGLTLQNFASITEQQIGGFIQVGAHGTGASIPPVDEQVVGVKLITPAAGELVLSATDEDPSLFQLARTSLGLLGIVTEVTLQCVPSHKLIEETLVMSCEEVFKQHETMMKENRHLRYMWIPHTDCVVVVKCNLMEEGKKNNKSNPCPMDERLKAARDLLESHPKCKLTKAQILELGFTTLRDELLTLDPLNVEWVKRVNGVEAEFWKKSQGVRVDWSDKILQFDCGGQQWVSEVAFPISGEDAEQMDIRYMRNLLDMIDREKVPAPAPIEQRWSAPSFSPMSPAAEKPDTKLPSMYSWVGIIMYLPDSSVNQPQRDEITKAFKGYKQLCEKSLWSEVRAVEHWAKIEMPDSTEAKARLQLRTHQKYPIDGFKAICKILDPHGILRNELTDVILGIV